MNGKIKSLNDEQLIFEFKGNELKIASSEIISIQVDEPTEQLGIQKRNMSAINNKKFTLNKGIPNKQMSSSLWKFKTPLDTIQFKLDYTRYCLQKYRKDQLTGIGLILVGSCVMAVTNQSFINGSDKAEQKYLDETALAGNSFEGKIWALRKYQRTLSEIDQSKELGLIIGGASIVSGSVMYVLSYRWLKKAYIFPYYYGLGVAIKF
ncbi:MAG: hypothetical protein Q8T08_08790 [Ignavibacteria bacterium]|nr:hypothetical protein [Ignavibacteria bacterium]